MSGEICSLSDSVTISVEDGIPPVEEIKRKFRLEVPSYAFVDDPVPISGTTPESHQHFYIMLSEKSFGVDWLDIDETLYEGISNAESKYEVEIPGFKEIGISKVYAAIKQTDFRDMSFWEKYKAYFWRMVLPEFMEKMTAIKTKNQTIIVTNWVVIGGIIAMIGFVGYRLYKKKGGK